MGRGVWAMCCAVGLATGVGIQQRPAGGGVRFAWGVLARIDKQPVAVDKDVTLKAGDGVRIFLGHVTPSFSYLLREDTGQRLILVHPSSLSRDKPDTGNLYFPSEGGFYDLDSATGTEHLYVVVSAARQTALERLLSDYRSATAESRAKLHQAILEEIARLSREQSSAAWSERPVTMGGQVRDPGAPAPGATEISGGTFAYRVVTIHRR